MPEYINPNNYVVHLTGPNGETVQVRGHQRIVLSEFFERYVARGFIRPIATSDAAKESPQRPIQARIQVNRSVTQRRISPPPTPPTPVVDTQAIERRARREEIAKARKLASTASVKRRQAVHPQVIIKNTKSLVIGRALNTDPNELLRNNLAKNNYPISNNIGVGILSYNRGHCLRRLIESIIKTTDLRRTTVFISDDASDDANTRGYLDELSTNPNIVVIRNETRLGIAGNSNRLLRCLSRFAYGILLNDDIEVRDQGWEYFYPEAMQKTGFHHFMYQQPGVYGAEEGETVTRNEMTLKKVTERPHGAILAFSNQMLQTVGYFDESYGLYGMEHVDWSQRAWELGLQEAGFFDVGDSGRLFSIHTDASAVQDRGKHLLAARKTFATRTPRRVDPSPASKVPEVSYIIPFRNFERTGSIRTVINNVRAQRYPVIHTIMVEQDSETGIDLLAFEPVTYLLAKETDNLLFNKSKAFNLAASRVTSECVILHDADMLSQGHYTSAVMKILKDYESCHLGSTVIYTSQVAMEQINTTGIVDENVKCERVVGYYEGGSIACRMKAFWKIGAFNEDYWGYGCEDCDFYARLSGGSNWKEDRVFDFLHLWHSRVPGWNVHHEQNKQIEGALKAKTISLRIQLQHAQLERLGYAAYVMEAMR